MAHGTLPHLRVARRSPQIDRIAEMYCAGLGVQVLGSFTDHDGFDGIMVGTPGGSYHLEFTQRHGDGEPAPSDDERLLVLYLPDAEDWRIACERMVAAGFRRVPAANPYWDRDGATFADLDGERVVLQRAAWDR